jgi:glycosyltransferase involved in cell wall biosynthesis
MKVAFISFEFMEYSVRLASAIAQSADVLLLLPKCDSAPYLQLLQGSVETEFFQKPRLRQALQQARLATHLVRIVKDFKPDVIHFQSGHLWFSLALPMLGDTPLVVTVHDPCRHLGENSHAIVDWALDRACYQAQQRIVHAPQMKDLLVQRFGVGSDTVHVVPHILIGDNSILQDECEDENSILFFGRIWEYKGLEYLIKAEPLITARFPKATFVIAGTGEDFSRYRQMMVHRDRFVVHNEHVSDSKRAELFRRASMVVLPYVDASQSGVIPIAYRFGKAVVATNVGGLPAMVDHGHTGYLVPPRDSEALAEAIILLLENKEMRCQFGRNGRRKVNIEWAPEVVAEKTLAIYRLAINGAHQVYPQMAIEQ